MDLTDTIDRIKTGHAMLFCGAGFSTGSINLDDREPLLAKDLARKICNIGGFEEDDDLMYSSDYFISKCPHKKQDLIKELKNIYTVRAVSDSIKKICSHKWRRIYTTNYDNTIEFATNQIGQYIDSLTIDDNPRDEYKKECTCIHINGSINKLNDETLDSTFKLSHSSYVSPKSFGESQWYYPFKKDLELASALIFIGYSLYDIDIEKILFATESKFYDKTIFIVSESESEKTKYRLEKYGKVEPIGIDSFADKLGYCSKSKIEDIDVYGLRINKYEISDMTTEINDEEIIKFMLQGVLASGYIDNFITGSPKKPFFIVREKTNQILDALNSGRHVAIYSDFGNGKTIYLEYLKSFLTISGKLVYYVSDYDIDYTKDIDIITKSQNDIFLIIDGYSNYIPLLDYIFTMNLPNLKLILSDRTGNHMFHCKYLEEHIEYYEFNVNSLSGEKEIDSMIDIISNLGFWGDKINWGIDRKRTFLSDTNNSKLSSILLSVFDSPQIKTRMGNILSPLLSDTNYKKVVFAICLINVMNLQAKESLISEVAMNDLIYDHKFVSKQEFKELFVIKEDKIEMKSSIFTRSIIHNHFSSSYIIDLLLEIVEKFEKIQKAGNIEYTIFRFLLRFSFIESLLPDQQKLNSLRRYYENLKVVINWLNRDPHFWLQYGMAELSFPNLDNAQRYFSNAYELAQTRVDQNGNAYDTSYIDTQQARLYLQTAIRESDGKKVYDYFMKAHDLLRNIKISHYTCRQILLYKDVYEKKIDLFSPDLRQKFVKSCSYMNSMIKKAQHTERYVTDDEYLYSCVTFLDKIISENIQK